MSYILEILYWNQYVISCWNPFSDFHNQTPSTTSLNTSHENTSRCQEEYRQVLASLQFYVFEVALYL